MGNKKCIFSYNKDFICQIANQECSKCNSNTGIRKFVKIFIFGYVFKTTKIHWVVDCCNQSHQTSSQQTIAMWIRGENMLLKLIKQSLTNNERFSVIQDTGPKIVFNVDLQPLQHGPSSPTLLQSCAWIAVLFIFFILFLRKLSAPCTSFT